MIILNQTSGSVILVKKAELYLEGQCMQYTEDGQLPSYPLLLSPPCPNSDSYSSSREPSPWSLKNAHLCLQHPWGTSMHLVLGGTHAGDNALFKPSVTPLAHKGAESFQWASALVCPLRIHPWCFLQSSRADHSFLMPLPHASIGKNQDLQSTWPSQGHLALGLSGPDFSSGRRTSLM